MTAPRQLLGWTVPEHVMSFDVAPNELTLWCFKHEPRVGSGRITRDGEHRPDQIIDFLKAHAHGETVEYRPNLDPDVAWPLPGVLPETPEPPKAPFGIDPTDECQNVLCSRINGKCVGYHCARCGEPCSMLGHEKCREAGRAERHAARESSPTPLLPLSAPVETEGRPEDVSEALSPQSATELKLWNLLDKAEEEYDASDEPCDRKSALVRAILAEGWRPPLPPLSKVAPFDPDDETPPALVASFLAPWFDGHTRLAAGAARGLDVLGLLASPLPADEVEWQWGCGSSIDDIFSLDEATARENAASTGVLRKRRAAGPWVAVPVEPKETNHG